MYLSLSLHLRAPLVDSVALGVDIFRRWSERCQLSNRIQG